MTKKCSIDFFWYGFNTTPKIPIRNPTTFSNWLLMWMFHDMLDKKWTDQILMLELLRIEELLISKVSCKKQWTEFQQYIWVIPRLSCLDDVFESIDYLRWIFRQVSFLFLSQLYISVKIGSELIKKKVTMRILFRVILKVLKRSLQKLSSLHFFYPK